VPPPSEVEHRTTRVLGLHRNRRACACFSGSRAEQSTTYRLATCKIPAANTAVPRERALPLLRRDKIRYQEIKTKSVQHCTVIHREAPYACRVAKQRIE
jgi:hypothetical protein